MVTQLGGMNYFLRILAPKKEEERKQDSQSGPLVRIHIYVQLEYYVLM
jgi:hypothetical protein